MTKTKIIYVSQNRGEQLPYRIAAVCVFSILTVIFLSPSISSAAGMEEWRKPIAELEHKYDVLLEQTKKSVEQNPEDISAHLRLGELYLFRNQNLNLAKNEFNYVISRDPKNAWAYYGRALSNFYQSSDQVRNDLEKALSLAGEAKLADFKFTGVYERLASYYYDNEDYAQAIKNYDELLQLDPDYDEIHYLRGITFLNMGNTEAQEKEFLAQITKTPNHSASLYQLGLLYSSLKKFDKAEPLLIKAVELEPDQQEYLSALALLYRDNKAYDKAMNIYQTMALKQNKPVWPYFYMGKIREMTGDLTGAEEYYKMAWALGSKKEKTAPYSVYQQQIFPALAGMYKKLGQKGRLVGLIREVPSIVENVGLCFIPLVLLILYAGIRGVIIARNKDDDPQDIAEGYFNYARKVKTGKWVMLGAGVGLYYYGQLQSYVSYLGINEFLLLGVYFLLISFTVDPILWKVDQVVRKTQTPLSGYFRLYVSGMILIFVNYIYIALLIIYASILKNDFWGITGQMIFAIALTVLLNYSVPYIIKRVYPLRKTWPESLRAKLTGLSKKAATDCDRIYVVETGKLRVPNAFATGLFPVNHHVFLMSSMVDEFEESEVETVFLHELGHHKHGHIVKRLIGTLIFLPIVYYAQWWMHFNFLVVIALLFIYFDLAGRIWRKQEKEADAFVVQNGGDANIFIKALEKIYVSNFIPKKFKSRSHPTLNQRKINLQKITAQMAGTVPV